MNPLIALQVLSAGLQLGFTGAGLRASRMQERLDIARNNLEVEQARVSAEEAAYDNSLAFRQSMGSVIAQSATRGSAGGSALAQFTSESYANFTRDQERLARRQRMIGVVGALGLAEAKSQRFGRDVSLLGSLGKGLFESVNLNAFGGKRG